jgi:Fic family protein
LAYEAEPDLTESSKFADIQEIINYRNAMSFAVKELQHRPITLNLMKRIHRILLDSVRGRHKGRGQFRTQQNYIGAPGGIENASYVPPEPQALQPLLANLEQYIHSQEKDRLVQIALIHAQFELIHPFLDGNGRVGRILIPLFLYEKDMLSSPMLYISTYLELHRQEYYAQLRAVSERENYNAWVKFFLTAVSAQARADAQKAQDIHRLYEHMKGYLPGILRSQFTVPALDVLFARPIFTSSQFIKDSDIPKGSAQRILKRLQEQKVLSILRPGQGRSPNVYMFNELVSIVER